MNQTEQLKPFAEAIQIRWQESSMWREENREQLLLILHAITADLAEIMALPPDVKIWFKVECGLPEYKVDDMFNDEND